MTADAALRAEGLGRRYTRRGEWALKEVDLAIPRGAITALVGPNGAGKSTLIRCWVGFERPDEGRVVIHGLDPTTDRRRVLELVGYVPQATALYQTLSVDDHFRFTRLHRREFDLTSARKRVRNLGIDPRRRVRELSGGEQAQVILALVLAMRPEVLLLDEPLASLDPLARRDFLTVLMADVRATGATAVLSSHIVTDVEAVCDRLILVADGQVVLHDSLVAVRSRYRTVPAAVLGSRSTVATFSGPTGEKLALVRTEDPSLMAASLEEVVLGHLALAQLSRRASIDAA